MGIMQRAVNWIYALAADASYKKFRNDTLRAGEMNRETLQEILKGNSETVYGQLHRFSELHDTGKFKREVPLTAYADYEPYIDEIAAGKEKVLTADPVMYFGLSSGTTGKQKKIPMTAHSRKSVNMAMMFIQHGLLRQALKAARKGGKGLLLMNMLQSGSTSGGIPTGAATSGGARSMKKVLPYFWTSPPEVLAIPEQNTANYLHLLFALTEQNLTYMMSPFSSGIVQLFGVLSQKGSQLAEDIIQGHISRELYLDPELKVFLEQKLKANPQRGSEIQKELERGMEGIATRLWPELSYVSCVCGGSFSIYEDKLKYFIGNTPIYSAIYGATEALIGLAPEVNQPTYVIAPRAAYFEFIPFEDSDLENPSTFDLDQLQVGQAYEIVVTTWAGLYRYRLGDIIKVAGIYNTSPIVEFICRKGQLLNLTGEKTSEAAVQQALSMALKDSHTAIEDYTTTLDLGTTTGHYNFYLEISPEQRDFMEISTFRNTLESCLTQANPRYGAGVEGNRISPCEVKLVQDGTFQKVRQELIKRGASVTQVKIPRLIRDQYLISILEAHIEKHS